MTNIISNSKQCGSRVPRRSDESFAALDPENLRHALLTARERAPSLLVVAHP
jgi:hypothetical protein